MFSCPVLGKTTAQLKTDKWHSSPSHFAFFFHCLTVVQVLFCSLIKGITPRICMLCFGLHSLHYMPHYDYYLLRSTLKSKPFSYKKKRRKKKRRRRERSFCQLYKHVLTLIGLNCTAHCNNNKKVLK